MHIGQEHMGVRMQEKEHRPYEWPLRQLNGPLCFLAD